MYECGEQEVGVVSGCGYKEVQYIDFLILLIPTPFVSVLFYNKQHPYFLFIFLMCFVLLERRMPNRDFLLRAART